MSRRFSPATLLVLLGAATAAAVAWSGPRLLGFSSATAARGAERVVELVYESDISGIPQGAKKVEVWIPLAPSTVHQTIEEREIVVPAPRYEIVREGRFGNPAVHFELAQPPGNVGVRVRYRATVRGSVEPMYAVKANGILLADREKSLALDSNRLMLVDDRVRSLAREVTRGAKTDLERARAVYDHVLRSVAYDKTTPGWGRGDTLRACEVGKGNCTDFHSLFVSLARASGVPARFQMGVPIPEDTSSGEIPGYHCWAEFFLEGRGWVPVDASEAWKHPDRREEYFGTYVPNRLLLVTGRDLVLSPRHASEPLNLWIAPYVEVDGRPLDEVKALFSFAALQS